MTTYTARGFAVYTQFPVESYDGKPREFSVQESSLATERRVWIGTDDPTNSTDPSDRAHLNETEARKVRDALSEFLGDDTDGEWVFGNPRTPDQATRAYYLVPAGMQLRYAPQYADFSYDNLNEAKCSKLLMMEKYKIDYRIYHGDGSEVEL